MVHGFGASVGHFRKLAQELALDYHVFAIDLLGMRVYDSTTTVWDVSTYKTHAFCSPRSIIAEIYLSIHMYGYPLLFHHQNMHLHKYRPLEPLEPTTAPTPESPTGNNLPGFGASDKPASETYNPALWQAQVADFVDQVIGRPAILVGNSIGSQVVAAVAAACPASVAALCLLNCTGAMNARGLYQDDPRLLLLMPVFAAFEAALRVPAIATLIFSNFRCVCS